MDVYYRVRLNKIYILEIGGNHKCTSNYNHVFSGNKILLFDTLTRNMAYEIRILSRTVGVFVCILDCGWFFAIS